MKANAFTKALLFIPRYSKEVSLVEITQINPINVQRTIAVRAVWYASLVEIPTNSVTTKETESNRFVALLDSPMRYSNRIRFLNARNYSVGFIVYIIIFKLCIIGYFLD
jgi:hypothetical protein